MTTYQAIERIAQRYSNKRYEGLTPSQILDAIDALNSGMMEVFRWLPQEYRTKTLYLPVLAPATVSLTAVEGSATLGNAPFTSAQAGRTVVAQGDAIWHQVADTNALRDVWLGSSGVNAATVYHDFVFGEDYPFDRLLTNPILYDGASEVPLCLINPETQSQTFGGSNRNGFAGGAINRTIGKPYYYWIEAAGASQGSEPVIAIRLLPLPDRAYRIRVKASYWPRRVLFPDIASAATLPVPDVCVESLIQLCGMHLSGIPGWDAMKPDAITAKATYAREFLSSQPSLLSLPGGRIYTPPGW